MIERKDNLRLEMSVEPARGRVTARNDFASMLKRGASQAAGALANGVSAAAAVIPGANFVSAVASAVGSITGAVTGSGSGDKWSLLQAQQKMQEEGFMNSLRLLQLQRRMNRESQQFSAISNVEKVRHDMAKTAINNIR